LSLTHANLPDFARKSVGSQVVLKQTDSWQIESRVGRIDVAFESKPISTCIDMHLETRGAGSRLKLAFDIQADVPLIGKKVEKALAEPLQRRMHDDLKVTADMAGDYARSHE